MNLRSAASASTITYGHLESAAKVSKCCMCQQTITVDCTLGLVLKESKLQEMQRLLFYTLDWQKSWLMRGGSADLSHRFQPEMPSLDTAMPMLRELPSATPSYHITNLQCTHKAW